MIDFVLGLFLAGLLVRGWLRGFVREALDLVALIVGLWIALRLSGPLGEFLTDRFGVGPEAATIGAGVTLFILFGLAMSVAAHFLSRVMTLPGLNLINRFGGAAVAALWGIAIVLVVVNVARVLPGGWEAGFESSAVAQSIAGPDAIPQRVFETVAPDGVLGSLAAIQGLFGADRAIPEGNEVLAIPPARPDEVRQVRGETEAVLDRVNEHRAGLGLAALGRSGGLDGIAESRAVGMYTGGRLSRNHPPGGNVATDVASAGIRLVVAGENLALASSTRAAFDGMLDSPTALAQFSISAYDRTGISVVAGPTGRLVVIVMGG
ncbi:MAG: CvpA family protein [Acidimicrobiia bacterium]